MSKRKEKTLKTESDQIRITFPDVLTLSPESFVHFVHDSILSTLKTTFNAIDDHLNKRIKGLEEELLQLERHQNKLYKSALHNPDIRREVEENEEVKDVLKKMDKAKLVIGEQMFGIGKLSLVVDALRENHKAHVKHLDDKADELAHHINKRTNEMVDNVAEEYRKEREEKMGEPMEDKLFEEMKESLKSSSQGNKVH